MRRLANSRSTGAFHAAAASLRWKSLMNSSVVVGRASPAPFFLAPTLSSLLSNPTSVKEKAFFALAFPRTTPTSRRLLRFSLTPTRTLSSNFSSRCIRSTRCIAFLIARTSLRDATRRPLRHSFNRQTRPSYAPPLPVFFFFFVADKRFPRRENRRNF